MGQVTHKFFADAAAAEREIVRLERKYTDLENRITQVSRKSRSGQQGFTGQVGQWVGGLGRIAAGYIGVNTAVQGLIATNRQYFAEVEEAAAKVFDIFQRFRVQSGLRGLEAEEAQGEIGRVALVRGVPLEQAGATATQLVSSGFSVDDAKGRALDSALKVLQASNLARPDVDPAQTIKAASSYLAAQGLEKNAQNLERVGVQFQRLFLATDVQLSDLQTFAPQSAGLAGLLSVEEQFAAFDIARGIAGQPESAAVFLRNFGATLGGSSESASAQAALEKLGLTSQDVDFVGENLGTVLDRLSEGLEALPEERRLGVLSQLFEKRGAPLAKALIRDRDKIDDLIATQKDVAGFEDDVREASSGRNALLVRQQIRKELQLASEDQGVEGLFNEAQELDRERGRWIVRRAFRRGLANARLFFSTGDEEAVNNAIDFAFDDQLDGESTANRVRRRAADLSTAEGAERYLKTIADNTSRGKLNPKGNSE